MFFKFFWGINWMNGDLDIAVPNFEWFVYILFMQNRISRTKAGNAAN